MKYPLAKTDATIIITYLHKCTNFNDIAFADVNFFRQMNNTNQICTGILDQK